MDLSTDRLVVLRVPCSALLTVSVTHDLPVEEARLNDAW